MKILVALGLLVLVSCSGRSEMVGRYEAISSRGEETVRVVMTLAADGTGKWLVATEETVFSWSVEGDHLRIYTRLGGVVEGRVQGTTVHLDVPGWGVLEFRR